MCSSPQPEMASRADEGRRLAGEDPELWSSKALNLAWLPRCDNWSNPCLLPVMTAAVAGFADPAAADDPHRKGGVLRWFWRADATFGAWAIRAIHRAGRATADLPGVVQAFDVLRSYLTVQCSAWAEAERLATAGPIVLPGTDWMGSMAHMARYGLGPTWDGWEKYAG